MLSLIDNDKYLDEIKESNPLSFKEALSKNKEDIFKVWKETYHLDFITNGLFEDDIAKYEIGKTKHTVEELKPISENDIQGKYHEFATILRQHNVSGRENATYRVFSLQGKLYNNLLNLPAFDGFDDEIEIWLAFNGYMNTR